MRFYPGCEVGCPQERQPRVPHGHTLFGRLAPRHIPASQHMFPAQLGPPVQSSVQVFPPHRVFRRHESLPVHPIALASRAVLVIPALHDVSPEHSTLQLSPLH